MELISALMGALVGGALAIFGANWQLRSQRRQRLISLAAALSVEVASLVQTARRNRYAEELREVAESLRATPASDEKSTYVFVASQSYFSVFEANAGDIGELPAILAVEVIAFYQQARSVLDSLSMTSRPDLKALEARELASHYDLIADVLDKVCTFGDNLVARLAPPDLSKHILHTARRLDVYEDYRLEAEMAKGSEGLPPSN